MLINIILLIVGIILGCSFAALLFYFYFKNKLSERIEKVEDELRRNELSHVHSFEEEYKRNFEEKNTIYKTTIAEAESRIETLRIQYTNTQAAFEEYRSSLNDKRLEVENLNKKALEGFLQSIGLEIEKEQEKLEKFKENCCLEQQNITKNLEELKESIRIATAQQVALNSGTELGYRIHISPSAIRELKELWDVINGLAITNKMPLYKAVFEMYIRAPLKMMLNSVDVPGGGIYKITDTTTGRIYIGKTVCFTDRWLTHVKRGSYYEDATAAGNGLYGAMKENGVWNFQFEVLERIKENEKLSEREKYWIEFFESDKTGLNLRRG